jgi:hypothetical protein
LNENQEIITPELVVESSNLPMVSDNAKAALFAAVGPLVDRRNLYAQKAATLVVKTEADAISANDVLKAIGADTKTALEAIKAHKDAAKARHALWTKFEAFFTEPFESAKKTIKGKVIVWQQAEQAKAAAEQRRLQGIADEKARREREALEKKAANYKTEEKREAAIEQAAATIAPTIIVEAPKVGIRARPDVVVEITDIVAFVIEAGSRHELCGFIDQDRLAANLKRAKASNKFFKCDGVTFSERMV